MPPPSSFLFSTFSTPLIGIVALLILAACTRDAKPSSTTDGLPDVAAPAPAPMPLSRFSVPLEYDITAVLRKVEEVAGIGLRVVARYAGPLAGPSDVHEAARQRVFDQAPKRVGLRFRVTRAVTWDHRKLS